MKHKRGQKRWDLISSVDDFNPTDEIKFRNPNIIRYKWSVFVPLHISSASINLCPPLSRLSPSLHLSSPTPPSLLVISILRPRHRKQLPIARKFSVRPAVNNTNFFLQGFPRPYSTNTPSFEVEEIWVGIGFVGGTWMVFF